MKRIIGKYPNKIYVKRLGEEVYNINFEFVVKLNEKEKKVYENMVVRDKEKLF